MSEEVITISLAEYERLKKLADAKDARLKKLHESEKPEIKREKALKYYTDHKDEINAKRREKRKKLKEEKKLVDTTSHST